jgi:hypothetical protein
MEEGQVYKAKYDALKKLATTMTSYIHGVRAVCRPYGTDREDLPLEQLAYAALSPLFLERNQETIQSMISQIGTFLALLDEEDPQVHALWNTRCQLLENTLNGALASANDDADIYKWLVGYDIESFTALLEGRFDDV